VLRWLLDEPGAPEVREALGAAELVLSSCLTLIECDRVLIRGLARKLLPEAEAAQRAAVLARAADHWVIFGLNTEITERARRPFPAEPVRSLDAIHLATALLSQLLVEDLTILSMDNRVRRSARQLGFEVLPTGAP
jgi:predicted nucleic acid-binding protein